MRDDARRTNASRRATRTPQTTSACSSAASRRGRSAGSFWRSASSVAISSPRAARKPASSAALWPCCASSASTRTRGSFSAIACRRAQARVAAPVVDEQDLETARPAAHGGVELAVQRLEALLLVVDGDHHREQRSGGHRTPCRPRRGARGMVASPHDREGRRTRHVQPAPRPWWTPLGSASLRASLAGAGVLVAAARSSSRVSAPPTCGRRTSPATPRSPRSSARSSTARAGSGCST